MQRREVLIGPHRREQVVVHDGGSLYGPAAVDEAVPGEPHILPGTRAGGTEEPSQRVFGLGGVGAALTALGAQNPPVSDEVELEA
ncbi:hypothetical protein Pth03_48590 [Planotetraspora thailandica]|uniref:Uncharacterized protein n=1 Tax=Planotetraspora thailandica TaxID=487172 RepID=A0A8J3V5K2_9ACTN|nr:hypothetical protein Pth03_48590 [Planotetraspora thailandica]